MTALDRVSVQRLRVAAAERTPTPSEASPIAPTRPRAKRLSTRWLLGLLLPLRILAVIGLTALVFHIVRERGDVGFLVWLQLIVLAMLTWTVWLHASMLVRRIGWIRRRSIARRKSPAGTLPLERATATELRLAAPGDLGVPRRGAAGAVRVRRGAAGATWWLLLGSIVVICALFIAIVVRWMVLDLDERGLGGWFVVQILLVGAALFAIGWTVRCAVRSVAQPAGRRSRSHVQRFFNWLLRLLSLGRYGRGAAAPMSSSAPAGAWTMSVVTQVGAVALLAVGVFGVGVAAATVENPVSADTDDLDLAGGHDSPDVADGRDVEVIVPDDPSTGGDEVPSDGESDLDDALVPNSFGATTEVTTSAVPTSTTTPTTSTTSTPASATTITTTTTTSAPTTTVMLGTNPLGNPAPTNPPPPPPPPPSSTNPPAGTTPTTVAITNAPTTTLAPTTTVPPTTSTTSATTTTAATTTTDPCPDGTATDCDGDGVPDRTEVFYKSDPNDPKSTPEHADYDSAFGQRSCRDGDDNDLDKYIDGEDAGCGGRG